MSIELIYDNKSYIGDLLEEVTISGDIMQAPRTLTFSLTNTADGKKRLFDFELGKPVRFLYQNRELFRGFIFESSIDSTGNQSITAYDEAIYLTKNSASRKFVSKKASDIVKQLCNEFNIEVGTIEDTGYVIPKMILRTMTLWDMMVTAITETKERTGRRYWLFCKDGKMNLALRTEQVSKWVLQQGENMYSASYNQDINELRNRVEILKGDLEQGYSNIVVSDATSIAKYGLMQHAESASSDDSDAKVREDANKLLKEKNKVNEEATIESVGIPDVIAGRSVYIREDITKLIGGYYVQNDSHRFSSGDYTMNITVKLTDELPELEYEDPSTGSSSANKTSTKLDVDNPSGRIFTIDEWDDLFNK